MSSASRSRGVVQFVGILVVLVGVGVTAPLRIGVAAAACTGDCDDNGTVVVTELIKGVNIALESSPFETCPQFDANGDRAVTVNEIVAAVNYALTACPVAEPTATPTPPDVPTATPTPAPPTDVPTLTPTVATPTVKPTDTPIVPPTAPPTPEPTATVPPPPTATQPAPATATASHTPLPTATPAPTAPPTPAGATKSAAGAAVMVANGMAVIPSVITAIVSGFEFGGSSLVAPETNLEDGGAAASCPKGGTASKAGALTQTITLTNCAVDTADGLLVVNGTVSLGLLTSSLTADIVIRFTDDAGTTTKLTQTAILNGTFSPTLGGNCYVTAATLQLSSGTLSSLAPGSVGAGVSFSGTTVNVTVDTFNSDCVPVEYNLRFNGPATVSLLDADGTPGGSFDATFSNFDVAQNATQIPTETRLDGGLSATCLGGAATIATRDLLQQAVGSLCPTEGVLRVTAAGTTSDVRYQAGGGVGIDTNLDGTPDATYPSCLDSALLQCVAG